MIVGLKRHISVPEKFWTWLGVLLAIALFFFLELRTISLTPPSWWGFLDQGRYLEAARAFYHGDWSPERHWYPPGYSLLAAPFAGLLPKDPFMPVNLLCLIGSMFAVRELAKSVGLPSVLGTAAFLLTTVFPKIVLRHYVLPWTSIPAGFLILSGLCLCLLPPKPKYSFVLGLILGAILLIKPIDAVALVPAGFYYFAQVFAPSGLSWRKVGHNVLSGLLSLGSLSLLAVFIHWKIYGWHLSAYEKMTTAGPVFLSDQLVSKLYGLFVDPSVLFGSFHEPHGLFARFPWIAAGLVGMGVGSCRKISLAALSGSVLAFVLLYASYYDLNPHNLWHYNTVHYFVWTFPVFALFGFYLLKELFVRRSFGAMAATVAAGAVLLIWHPYLQELPEAKAGFEKQELALDISGCAAPCVIDIEPEGSGFDARGIRQIRLAPETLRVIPARSSLVFPYDRNVRVLLWNVTGLADVRLSLPGHHPADIRSVRIFSMKWRLGLP
ncbi:MAG: hypothetical protein PHE27_06965 [Alphaproteobacteria bacterium]|nr:hypothetical protein [Alphaproteobacteria bacterium]